MSKAASPGAAPGAAAGPPPSPPAELPALDALLHQPTRTQLVAYLSGRGSATFLELRRVLGVTDGNLGAHLGKLVDADYVIQLDASPGGKGTTGAGRVRSEYSLTARGRAALVDYVQRLSTLVDLSGATKASPRSRGAGEPATVRAPPQLKPR